MTKETSDMAKRFGISICAAVAIIATVGTASADDIVLGFLQAGAGPFATFSKTNLVAAQMAIDSINAKGGIAGKKIRVITFDTAGKPDQAVVGLRKFADDDKVMAIIGPFSSSECRVAFPAAEQAGVPTMSMGSSAPKLAEPFTYAFRNTSDEGYLFSRVMRALQEHNLPIATAALAYATDDVVSKTMGEVVLPNVMKKAGTDIKLSVTFQNQAFDLAPQVSQLVATPTDLIGVGSGPEAATRLAQELKRQGSAARLVAGSTIADPELPRLMGAAGDGTTIPTAFYGALDDRTKTFETEFIRGAKAAGIERSAAAQFDAATYDIVLMYAAAMKAVQVTGDPAKLAAERTAIRDELRRMKDFPALEGPISIGSNGDALKPAYIIEMKDSKWNLLATYPAGN
jgi:branched-chain amino acid transport system substrate-binding protein